MKENEIILQKLNEIASKKPSKWIEKAKEREANRDWSIKSAKIALLILNEIKARKISQEMSQKMLAEKMGVSAQYVNKILKGKENLSLETICKIEKALGISLIEIRSFEDNPETDDIFSNVLENLQSMKVYSKKCEFSKANDDFYKTYIIRQSLQAVEDISNKIVFSNFVKVFYKPLTIHPNLQFKLDLSEVEFYSFWNDIRKESEPLKKSESENIFA